MFTAPAVAGVERCACIDDLVIEALGILSGCLTTLSWVPQLLRTWKRGHADDISGPYLFSFGTGVVGWIVYGVLKRDVALIFANALTFLLLAGLLLMKYGRTTVSADRPGRNSQEG
jgi:MtN3 and saliva related transmembrane protein